MMKPCECGCGILIPTLDKKGRPARFIVGHNSRGRILSDATKKKVSVARKGKPLSREHREKLGKAHEGKALSEEHKHKISLAHTGQKRTEQAKQKMSDAGRRRYENPDARKVTSASLKGHSVPDSFKKRMSEAVTDLWKNPDYYNRQSKAIIAGGAVRPNKAELLLLDIISPMGFYYVGDGDLIIKRKNPDYTNGKKQLVELFGDYWHAGQSVDERIGFFKAEGWDCLVVWESELKNPDKVKGRVQSWMTEQIT